MPGIYPFISSCNLLIFCTVCSHQKHSLFTTCLPEQYFFPLTFTKTVLPHIHQKHFFHCRFIRSIFFQSWNTVHNFIIVYYLSTFLNQSTVVPSYFSVSHHPSSFTLPPEIMWFSSVPSGKCQAGILGHVCCVPYPFQLIIYVFIVHSFRVT